MAVVYRESTLVLLLINIKNNCRLLKPKLRTIVYFSQLLAIWVKIIFNKGWLEHASCGSGIGSIITMIQEYPNAKNRRLLIESLLRVSAHIFTQKQWRFNWCTSQKQISKKISEALNQTILKLLLLKVKANLQESQKRFWRNKVSIKVWCKGCIKYGCNPCLFNQDTLHTKM